MNSRPTHRKYSWLSIVTLLLFSADVSAEPSQLCERYRLQNKPQWISSAAVLPWSGELLVSDPSPENRRLLLYDARLQLRTELDGWGDIGLSPLQEGDAFSPVSIEVALDNGIRVGLLGYEPLWLAPDLRPISQLARLEDTGEPSAHDSEVSVSYYSNSQLIPGGFLIGYGAIVQGLNTKHESFELGFVSSRASPSQPVAHDAVMMMPHSDNTYYLLGYPYVANNSSGSFAVAMSEAGAQLYQLYPGSKRSRLLRGLVPEDYPRVPKIEMGRARSSDALSVLSQFRNSRVVAGLYAGQADQLFILTREPTAGATIWTLHEISISRRALGERLVLPTLADQITIAQGESSWYVFERRDTGLNQQDIATVLRLPTSWLDSPSTSPLRAGMPAPDCTLRDTN